MRHDAIAPCLRVVTCASVVTLAACSSPAPAPPPPPAPQESSVVADLQSKIRRFAPVDIAADVASLPTSEQQALGFLVQAARLMDGLFLEQVWAGNPSVLLALAGDQTPEGQAERHYFLINKGPWSRLDEDAVFVRRTIVPEKPPQANYYPADATREEVDTWFNSLSGPARSLATGFFSVIRRDQGGKLIAVPYSVEYRNTLIL